MNETILQGLLLMGVGMGTVFAFLILLSVILALSAHVVPKLAFMLPDPEPAKPKLPAKPAGDKGAEIALAVAAALKRRA